MSGRKYSVIIADDDFRICMLIKKLVDWDLLGLDLLGEYYNGKEAFGAIQKLKPDIVITDIVMPGMDGFELIRRTQSISPKTEFIILSGHSTYEYAYTAIKYGVRDYLLKPVNQMELCAILLGTLKRIIDKERKRYSSYINDKNGSCVKHSVLEDILNGTWDNNEASFKAINSKYSTEYIRGMYLIAAVKPDIANCFKHEHYEIILEKIKMYMGIRIKDKVSEFQDHVAFGVLFFIFNAQDGEKLTKAVYEVFEETKLYYSDYTHLTMGLSDLTESPGANDAMIARRAVGMRIDLGVDRVITAAEVQHDGTAKDFVTLEELDLLGRMVRDERRDDIKSWFQACRDRDMKSAVNAEDYVKGVEKIINTVQSALCVLYDDQNAPTDAELIREHIRHTFSRIGLINAAENWTNSNIDAYSKANEQKRCGLICEVMKIIDQKCVENLTLAEMAESIHIPPEELEELLMKIERKSFEECMIMSRMKIAKNLLKTTRLSMAKISEQVGYNDSGQFAKAFTKTVGLKPKDFRRLYDYR